MSRAPEGGMWPRMAKEKGGKDKSQASPSGSTTPRRTESVVSSSSSRRPAPQRVESMPAAISSSSIAAADRSKRSSRGEDAASMVSDTSSYATARPSHDDIRDVERQSSRSDLKRQDSKKDRDRSRSRERDRNGGSEKSRRRKDRSISPAKSRKSDDKRSEGSGRHKHRSHSLERESPVSSPTDDRKAGKERRRKGGDSGDKKSFTLRRSATTEDHRSSRAGDELQGHHDDLSSQVVDQFPGQFPSQSTLPYRPPLSMSEGGPGLASEYYNDFGESVSSQPGVRPSAPNLMINPEPHLQAASPVAAPPIEPSTTGGVGAAADFYAQPASSQAAPAKQSKPGKSSSQSSSRPSRPGKISSQSASQSSSFPTASAAMVGAAAAGASPNHFLAENQTTQSGSQPIYDSPPSYTSQGPSASAPPGKLSSHSHAGLYAAGAAAAAAAASHHHHHHQHSEAEHYSLAGSPHHAGNGNVSQIHRHRGPVSKFVDFWKDPVGVAQFEEYTEYIGVCRYCFEPGTTPREAPRRHHYRRQRSFERQRIDKDSRYLSNDGKGPRRGGTSWATAGLAGYGVAKMGKSLFGQKRSSNESLSSRNRRASGSTTSFFGDKKHRSPERGSTTSVGVVSRHRSRSGSRKRHGRTHSRSSPTSHHRRKSRSRDRAEMGVTRDGRVYKKDPHGSFFGNEKTTYLESGHRRRSQSRSRSRTRRGSRSRSRNRKDPGLMAAAASATLGASVAASQSSSKHRTHRSSSQHSTRRHRSQSPLHRSTAGSTKSKTSKHRSHGKHSPRRRPSPGESGNLFGASSPPRRHSRSRTPGHRKRRKGHKKQKGFFGFGNSSSSSVSSVDTALVYGSEKSSKRKGEHIAKKKGHGADAAILGLGAAAAAAALASNSKKSARGHPDLVAVRQPKDAYMPSRRLESKAPGEDEGWESASEGESMASSVSSGLAFGSFIDKGKTITNGANSSQESLASRDSDTGVDKWGWRWGRRSSRSSDNEKSHTTMNAAGAGVAGMAAGAALASASRTEPAEGSTESVPSLQNVYPVPTSDPARFDVRRQDSISSRQSNQPMYTSRPAPVPLQQPQPVAPVSSTVYSQRSYNGPSGPPVFAEQSESSQTRPPLPNPPIDPFQYQVDDDSWTPAVEQAGERKFPNVKRRATSPAAVAGPAKGAWEDVDEPVTSRDQFEVGKKESRLERALRREAEQQAEAKGSRKDNKGKDREKRRRSTLDASTKEIKPSRSEEEKSHIGNAVIAGVGGIAAGVAISEAMRRRNKDEKLESDSRSPSAQKSGQSSREEYGQIYDVNRNDELNRAADPSSSNIDKIVKQAAAKIAVEDREQNVRSVLDKYSEEELPMSAFFAPPELSTPSSSHSLKDPFNDPALTSADAPVVAYDFPDIVETAPPDDGSSAKDQVYHVQDVDSSRLAFPWLVPNLRLIAPTPSPPPDLALLQDPKDKPISRNDSDLEESRDEQDSDESPKSRGKTSTSDIEDQNDLSGQEKAEQSKRRHDSVEREASKSPPNDLSSVMPKHMPGSFEDDTEFAATLAAGLEDSGFDPSIVVDDASYRRRESPPGSEGAGTYSHSQSSESGGSRRASPDSAAAFRRRYPSIESGLAQRAKTEADAEAGLTSRERRKLRKERKREAGLDDLGEEDSNLSQESSRKSEVARDAAVTAGAVTAAAAFVASGQGQKSRDEEYRREEEPNERWERASENSREAAFYNPRNHHVHKDRIDHDRDEPITTASRKLKSNLRDSVTFDDDVSVITPSKSHREKDHEKKADDAESFSRDKSDEDSPFLSKKERKARKKQKERERSKAAASSERVDDVPLRSDRTEPEQIQPEPEEFAISSSTRKKEERRRKKEKRKSTSDQPSFEDELDARDGREDRSDTVSRSLKKERDPFETAEPDQPYIRTTSPPLSPTTTLGDLSTAQPPASARRNLPTIATDDASFSSPDKTVDFSSTTSPTTPSRETSSTAIPLSFRRPRSFHGFSKSSPISPSAVSEPSQPLTPPPRPSRHGKSVSTEFKSSKEFRPLYLVERHSYKQEPVADEEVYPSLPSSHTTSRASSEKDPEEAQELHRLGLEDVVPAASFVAADYLLDSTQSTPRASTFRDVGGKDQSPSRETNADDHSSELASSPRTLTKDGESLLSEQHYHASPSKNETQPVDKADGAAKVVEDSAKQHLPEDPFFVPAKTSEKDKKDKKKQKWQEEVNLDESPETGGSFPAESIDEGDSPKGEGKFDQPADTSFSVKESIKQRRQKGKKQKQKQRTSDFDEPEASSNEPYSERTNDVSTSLHDAGELKLERKQTPQKSINESASPEREISREASQSLPAEGSLQNEPEVPTQESDTAWSAPLSKRDKKKQKKQQKRGVTLSPEREQSLDDQDERASNIATQDAISDQTTSLQPFTDPFQKQSGDEVPNASGEDESIYDANDIKPERISRFKDERLTRENSEPNREVREELERKDCAQERDFRPSAGLEKTQQEHADTMDDSNHEEESQGGGSWSLFAKKDTKAKQVSNAKQSPEAEPEPEPNQQASVETKPGPVLDGQDDFRHQSSTRDEGREEDIDKSDLPIESFSQDKSEEPPTDDSMRPAAQDLDAAAQGLEAGPETGFAKEQTEVEQQFDDPFAGMSKKERKKAEKAKRAAAFNKSAAAEPDDQAPEKSVPGSDPAETQNSNTLRDDRDLLKLSKKERKKIEKSRRATQPSSDLEAEGDSTRQEEDPHVRTVPGSDSSERSVGQASKVESSWPRPSSEERQEAGKESKEAAFESSNESVTAPLATKDAIVGRPAANPNEPNREDMENLVIEESWSKMSKKQRKKAEKTAKRPDAEIPDDHAKRSIDDGKAQFPGGLHEPVLDQPEAEAPAAISDDTAWLTMSKRDCKKAEKKAREDALENSEPPPSEDVDQPKNFVEEVTTVLPARQPETDVSIPDEPAWSTMSKKERKKAEKRAKNAAVNDPLEATAENIELKKDTPAESTAEDSRNEKDAEAFGSGGLPWSMMSKKERKKAEKRAKQVGEAPLSTAVERAKRAEESSITDDGRSPKDTQPEYSDPAEIAEVGFAPFAVSKKDRKKAKKNAEEQMEKGETTPLIASPEVFEDRNEGDREPDVPEENPQDFDGNASRKHPSEAFSAAEHPFQDSHYSEDKAENHSPSSQDRGLPRPASTPGSAQDDSAETETTEDASLRLDASAQGIDLVSERGAPSVDELASKANENTDRPSSLAQSDDSFEQGHPQTDTAVADSPVRENDASPPAKEEDDSAGFYAGMSKKERKKAEKKKRKLASTLLIDQDQRETIPQADTIEETSQLQSTGDSMIAEPKSFQVLAGKEDEGPFAGLSKKERKKAEKQARQAAMRALSSEQTLEPMLSDRPSRDPEVTRQKQQIPSKVDETEQISTLTEVTDPVRHQDPVLDDNTVEDSFALGKSTPRVESAVNHQKTADEGSLSDDPILQMQPERSLPQEDAGDAGVDQALADESSLNSKNQEEPTDPFAGMSKKERKRAEKRAMKQENISQLPEQNAAQEASDKSVPRSVDRREAVGANEEAHGQADPAFQGTFPHETEHELVEMKGKARLVSGSDPGATVTQTEELSRDMRMASADEHPVEVTNQDVTSDEPYQRDSSAQNSSERDLTSDTEAQRQPRPSDGPNIASPLRDRSEAEGRFSHGPSSSTGPPQNDTAPAEPGLVQESGSFSFKSSKQKKKDKKAKKREQEFSREDSREGGFEQPQSNSQENQSKTDSSFQAPQDASTAGRPLHDEVPINPVDDKTLNSEGGQESVVKSKKDRKKDKKKQKQGEQWPEQEPGLGDAVIEEPQISSESSKASARYSYTTKSLDWATEMQEEEERAQGTETTQTLKDTFSDKGRVPASREGLERSHSDTTMTKEPDSLSGHQPLQGSVLAQPNPHTAGPPKDLVPTEVRGDLELLDESVESEFAAHKSKKDRKKEKKSQKGREKLSKQRGEGSHFEQRDTTETSEEHEPYSQSRGISPSAEAHLAEELVDEDERQSVKDEQFSRAEEHRSWRDHSQDSPYRDSDSELVLKATTPRLGKRSRNSSFVDTAVEHSSPGIPALSLEHVRTQSKSGSRPGSSYQDLPEISWEDAVVQEESADEELLSSEPPHKFPRSESRRNSRHEIFESRSLFDQQEVTDQLEDQGVSPSARKDDGNRRTQPNRQEHAPLSKRPTESSSAAATLVTVAGMALQDAMSSTESDDRHLQSTAQEKHEVPGRGSSDQLHVNRDSAIQIADSPVIDTAAGDKIRDSGYHDNTEIPDSRSRSPPSHHDLATEESGERRRSSQGLSRSASPRSGTELATPQPFDDREPSPVDSTSRARDSALFQSPPHGKLVDDDLSGTTKPTSTNDQGASSNANYNPISSSTREVRGPPFTPPQETVEYGFTQNEDDRPSLFGGPVGIDRDAIDSPRPSSGYFSERPRLDTISEEVSGSRGGPDQERNPSLPTGGTSTGHPGADGEHRKPEDFVSTDELINRMSWPAIDDTAETVDIERAKKRSADHRPSSRHSNHSEVTPSREAQPSESHSHDRSPSQTLERFKSPDRHSRSPASMSNRSTGTPPLRRVDRSLSGDLRAASKSSLARLAKEGSVRSESPTTTHDPIQYKSKQLARDMAGVYEGWGDVPDSPRSPNRPHSVRRRQSQQQIMDLEARLEQLSADNRMLQEARVKAEQDLESVRYDNSRESNAMSEAVETHQLQLRDKDSEIQQLRETLAMLQKEVARLSELNDNLTNEHTDISSHHERRYNDLQAEHADQYREWEARHRELEDLRHRNGELSAGMETMVRHEISSALESKDFEIDRLRSELDAAKDQIHQLKRQILSSKQNESFLTLRDEDYFENACQQLCQHVQQWVLRFSKFSDMRGSRLVDEVRDDKIVDRLENAILDGTDVDDYLADRVTRRDVFMSVVMTMVWEYVFTRYLFGMDREQRQKLKSLEKILSEVGPVSAVQQWRATTLTLLSKRGAFQTQRAQDTEAVVQEIYHTLCVLLPPPTNLEGQIQESLRNVMRSAVELSIEMRTQKAGYMMLPPLQPEFTPSGDLAREVHFNASLMNERSGSGTGNDELESSQAIVHLVLFPLVVKKGDDNGVGDEEVVVCPAQVLVAGQRPRSGSRGRESTSTSTRGGLAAGGPGKKVVRVVSGERMSVDPARSSAASLDPSNVI